jgi:V/A-type H+-transporting ATPase subunit F
LAGASVVESSQDQAGDQLAELIRSNRYGLIAVDQGILEDPVRASERVMRGRTLPILVPISGVAQSFSASQDLRGYLGRLVRETIGFDIKL